MLVICGIWIQTQISLDNKPKFLKNRSQELPAYKDIPNLCNSLTNRSHICRYLRNQADQIRRPIFSQSALRLLKGCRRGPSQIHDRCVVSDCYMQTKEVLALKLVQKFVVVVYNQLPHSMPKCYEKRSYLTFDKIDKMDTFMEVGSKWVMLKPVIFFFCLLHNASRCMRNQCHLPGTRSVHSMMLYQQRRKCSSVRSRI